MWDWTLVALWCGRRGSGRAVYGHVITKFSGMGRVTYPWCSAGKRARAPLLTMITWVRWKVLNLTPLHGKLFKADQAVLNRNSKEYFRKITAIDSKKKPMKSISWQWKNIYPTKAIQLVWQVGRKTYVFLPRFLLLFWRKWSKSHPFSVKGTSTFEMYR